MKIVVVSPGMFTTVQDLGRPGYGLAGVSRAGAADALALRTGNRLLGNAEGAAALEMTLLGGTFLFPEGGRILLTGEWVARDVAAGETVRVGPIEHGARQYLCARGGLRVPLVAGSASTHVLSGLGGGAVRKGDTFAIGEPGGPERPGPVPAALRERRKVLRVTAGPQAAEFEAAVFYGAEYTVSSDSNRMGLRLEGAAIPSAHHGQMVTEGVSLGAIQVPPNGQPILLFVDQQTTGGYPKIANVITADLPSVGQLRPRDAVRFELVSNETAQRLLREQEALLAAL